MKSDKSLRKKFWESVAQFAIRAAGGNVHKLKKADTTTDYRQDSMDVDSFLKSVRQNLSDQGIAASGAIHIIRLDGMRKQFGSKWPDIADKVRTICQTVIERRLTPADVYTELEGPAFLIVFGKLGEKAAKLKTALIAEEIKKRFFGKAYATGKAGVDSAVAHVDRDAWVENADLKDLAAEARRGSSDSIETTDISLRVPGVPIKRIGSGDTGGNAFQWQTHRAARERVTGEYSGAPEIQWRTHSAVATIKPQSRADGLESAPSPDEEGSSVSFPDVHFIYRPMWDVRREVVSTYQCLPVRVDESGDIDFEDVLFPEAPDSDFIDLDILTLLNVTRDLQSLDAEGRKLLMCLPIHYRTLATPIFQCQRFFDLLKAIPEDLRRLLIAEVVKVPKGTPGVRLADVLTSIKPFITNVILQTELTEKDFSPFVGMWIHAVSADVSRIKINEKKLFSLMEGFTRRANASGLRTYIHGLRSLSQISAAIGAGFDYVDGDSVVSIADSPESVYRFKLEDLYAELLG